MVENKLVGGGFGGKEDVSVQHLAVLAALQVGRPVKAKLTRQESISFHPKRHYRRAPSPWAATRTASSPAWTARSTSTLGPMPPCAGRCWSSLHPLGGPLLLPEHRYPRLRLVHQQPPAGAFRGFGVCQSEFALESNINLLAEKVGISPGRSASATPSSRGRPSPTARLPTAPPPSRRPCWR